MLSNQKLDQFLINFRFQWTRILGYGVFGIGKRISRKILYLFLGIALLPCSLLFYLLGFRRLNIFTDRIGHLAIEPDTLLKAQQLGLIKPRRWFVLAPQARVANQHLLQYWAAHFQIYRSTISCFFLHCLSLFPFMRYDVSHFINSNNGPQFGYQVNKLWGRRSPLLTLTPSDMNWGNSQLALLGIPQDAWFVCIHAREGGFSPIDEALHCHRNSSIENLTLAIEEITRRGGWVVRLGDPTMIPMKAMPQMIDYAHHPLRSQRLDIILCARSRFILGNTSGMFLVGSIFGTPCALANMVPMPTLGFSCHDLSMPKLHWLETEKRYLSFPEVMLSPVSTFRYASLYEKSDINLKENTAEDIFFLTSEMLDRLDDTFAEGSEDLQRHSYYMSLFKPQHYSYGATSKTSFDFLRKYQYLLPHE